MTIRPNAEQVAAVIEAHLEGPCPDPRCHILGKEDMAVRLFQHYAAYGGPAGECASMFIKIIAHGNEPPFYCTHDSPHMIAGEACPLPHRPTGLLDVPIEAGRRFPLWCWVRGHGRWRRHPYWGGRQRHCCDRCNRLQLPATCRPGQR